ncbi:DinB family protein [Pseudomonas sp. RIT-PI-S]|uniref:DinB family protein n=1 Tax=Pseudomonas sp. RIT-PI-S TaxID=3035295 RepID=UPI0021D93478|nr:DinB family protein [Pseudomonas sp. RIT-PI-S]
MNYFLAQALNNQWANRRLLRACAGLSEAEYIADRTGFFPSIQRTLSHILDVDLYYLAALEEDLQAQTSEPAPALGFAELVAGQAASDQRLVTFCEALRVEDLSREVGLLRPVGLLHERIDRVLLHLFEHQIHHRGQVHAMLSGTPIKPPQLDEFFLDQDREAREPEASALGVDEPRVWRRYVGR